MLLTSTQKKEIENYFDDFRKDSIVEDRNVKMTFDVFDKKRIEAIPDIQKVITDFLNGKLSLTDFKEKSDSMSRTFPYWGFKGFSGQMQLNQYVNNIEDGEKERILKEALSLPTTLEEASQKINNFAEYLKKLKTATDNPKSIPRVNQSFMLSYFWEIQKPELYPVFFGSAKNILGSIGFDFKIQETAGDEYKYFVDIISSIRLLLEEERDVKGQFPVWFVEHILWRGHKQQQADISETDEIFDDFFKKKEQTQTQTQTVTVSESWIPPIISDLEQLALNQETDWSKKRGVKPEKAFETKLRYVFTILGFDVTELGQGKGREPDGVAISTDGRSGHYAIIYDAKAREKEFSVGTGDREIVEYIRKKERELQKQHVNKVSFLIVSSEFTENHSLDSVLKNIYRETRVPVILVKAKDLLDIVERKLSNSDIDHSQLEDLFLESGILTKDKIVDILG